MYKEWRANPKHKIIEFSVKTPDEIIQQIKNMVNEISPHLLESFGLLQTIKDFLKKTKNAFAITYSFNANLPCRLSALLKVIIYRILMKTIQSTLKHAQVNHTSIELTYEKNRIAVIYRDNGIEFDYSKVKN